MEFDVEGIPYEDEHHVLNFRRYLPVEGNRSEPLIQFTAARGGIRTVAVSNIVYIR